MDISGSRRRRGKVFQTLLDRCTDIRSLLVLYSFASHLRDVMEGESIAESMDMGRIGVWVSVINEQREELEETN